MSNEHVFTDLLGKVAKDRVTGMQGVISSVCFDLYGCVQVALTPPIDKDGKLVDGRWFDVNRMLVVDEERVMPVPKWGKTPEKHDHGPAEKPARDGVA